MSSSMSSNLWKRRAALLAGCAIVTVAAGLALAPPAAAGFVCQENGGTDGGSTASGVGNVACGTDNKADGTGTTRNVAIGNTANAAGNQVAGRPSNNTALGFFTNASGDGSQNTATGAGSRAQGNGSNNTANGVFAFANGDNSANVAVGAARSR